jgi:hypothetical protein
LIPDIFRQRRLVGGAGCAASGSPLWLLALPLVLLRRRLRTLIVLGVLLAVPQCTCRRVVPPPVIEEPPAPTGDVTTPVIPQAPDVEPAHQGTVCPGAPEMVQLDTGVCVDRFESTLDNGTARVVFGAVPAAGLTFTAAQAACAAAGKRLCTAAEWERACRGSLQVLYPYGDSFTAKKCNGFDAEWGELLEAGAGTECTSDFGTFDMSGNVAEWVNADYPFANGTDILNGKQLRGGSYIGNASGLTCTSLFGQNPDVADARAGIRCCRTP